MATKKAKNVVENEVVVKESDKLTNSIDKKSSLSNKGVVVNTEKLFVRNKPLKGSSKIVMAIPEGTEVTIELAEPINDFYFVSVRGQVGYCYKKYIELK